MDISVAICTWNRADLLDQTLQRFHQLEIPEGLNWELLVINNACTDRTEEVIDQHRDALPLRMVKEPRAGHSRARNRAIDVAQGRWLIWTDDDVLVSPGWLVCYWSAIHSMPDASFLGGPVNPWFEEPPAKWITESWETISSAFAIRQLGNEVLTFNRRSLPFGANFGLRLDVQKQYRYNPDLGRKEKEMLSGDETVVLRQMMADGHQGYWLPLAHLEHYIPAHRLTLDYVKKYYHGLGRTAVVVERLQNTTARNRRASKRVMSYAKMMFYSALYGLLRMVASPSWWVPCLAKSLRHRGRLAAYRETVDSPSQPAIPSGRRAA